MYRMPSSGGGRSGPGVSADGYDGANKFFDTLKTVAGELKMGIVPTGAQESAAAKAAVDAYMAARDGLVSGPDSLLNQGHVPNDFPQIDLKGSESMPSNEVGKAVSELMSHMGDMLGQMFQGPMGFLGSILNFLFKLFSEIATNIGQALADFAHAAAAAVEDAWKKQMEMASNAATELQPLELYNQAAVTQTLATALKNTAST